jgi:hypothetical protein
MKSIGWEFSLTSGERIFKGNADLYKAVGSLSVFESEKVFLAKLVEKELPEPEPSLAELFA